MSTSLIILPFFLASSLILAKSFSPSGRINESIIKWCIIFASLKSFFSKTKLFPISLSVVISLQKSALGGSPPFERGFPDFGALGFIFNLLSPDSKLKAKKDFGNSFNNSRILFPDISLSIKYLLTP